MERAYMAEIKYEVTELESHLAEVVAIPIRKMEREGKIKSVIENSI